MSFTSYFDGFNGIGKLRDIAQINSEEISYETDLIFEQIDEDNKKIESNNTRLTSYNGYSFATPSAVKPDVYNLDDKHSVRFNKKVVSYEYTEDNSAPSESYSTSDELPEDIAGHIVICIGESTLPSNMEYLVGSIRSSAYSAYIYEKKQKAKYPNDFYSSKHSSSITADYREKNNSRYKKLNTGAPILNSQPIVFLCSEPPSDKIKRGLQRYYGVYFVTGSPFLKADLVKARIMTASSAIVLLEPIYSDRDNNNSNQPSINDTSTFAADASTLISVINIETLTAKSPDFNLCVELNYRENMQFIGDSSPLEINNICIQSLMMPCFMSGNCLIPTMLDSLICQSFYNEDLIPLLKNLIFPRGDITREIEHSKMLSAGLSHRDLPSASNYLNQEDTSNIFLIPVPKKHINSTFSNLFFDMCTRFDAICIGLYRNSSTVTKNHNKNLNRLLASKSNNKDVEKELHNAKYFVVNPHSQTILHNDDRIYILSKNYPEC
ncbi:hypothetical protein BB561_004958 [Smittium simulii]|uniref:RCK N-terminal domain-containing protein n=1 Tax=Smittium simulii TaxID=133385 RepID=A0A2T9YD59_9FUNG|nr:hypothetical protein BB561_004958 [Smittium simulii]